MKTWEIALFVWCWQAASLSVAVAFGALSMLVAGHGWPLALLMLAIDPLQGLEKRYWRRTLEARCR